MTYIIALTGGIGSGKTTVTNEFTNLGIRVIDSDVIARQLVTFGSPALNAIVNQFGVNIIHSDGSLNRKRLRNIIFFENNKKKWLNNLLHPLIHQETQRQLRENDTNYILWVTPLLIENHLSHLANRILLIDVTPKEQISRTMKRDKISKKHVIQILKSQAHREKRLLYAHDIIHNYNGRFNISHTVAKLHKKYMLLSQQKYRNLL
ncbi:Dephospho-CoA kinase [Candidatus Hartigia pinicola]|nr:Dephospho-CoA kinase [Candidatus Hartigia pinicola]